MITGLVSTNRMKANVKIDDFTCNSSLIIYASLLSLISNSEIENWCWIILKTN